MWSPPGCCNWGWPLLPHTTMAVCLSPLRVFLLQLFLKRRKESGRAGSGSAAADWGDVWLGTSSQQRWYGCISPSLTFSLPTASLACVLAHSCDFGALWKLERKAEVCCFPSENVLFPFNITFSLVSMLILSTMNCRQKNNWFSILSFYDPFKKWQSSTSLQLQH